MIFKAFFTANRLINAKAAVYVCFTSRKTLHHGPISSRFAAKSLLNFMKSSSVALSLAHLKLDNNLNMCLLRER